MFAWKQARVAVSAFAIQEKRTNAKRYLILRSCTPSQAIAAAFHQCHALVHVSKSYHWLIRWDWQWSVWQCTHNELSNATHSFGYISASYRFFGLTRCALVLCLRSALTFWADATTVGEPCQAYESKCSVLQSWFFEAWRTQNILFTLDLVFYKISAMSVWGSVFLGTYAWTFFILLYLFKITTTSFRCQTKKSTYRYSSIKRI